MEALRVLSTAQCSSEKSLTGKEIHQSRLQPRSPRAQALEVESKFYTHVADAPCLRSSHWKASECKCGSSGTRRVILYSWERAERAQSPQRAHIRTDWKRMNPRAKESKQRESSHVDEIPSVTTHTWRLSPQRAPPQAGAARLPRLDNGLPSGFHPTRHG